MKLIGKKNYDIVVALLARPGVHWQYGRMEETIQALEDAITMIQKVMK